MKCHFIIDDEVGRVLIPECWPVVHSNDIEDCICGTRRIQCPTCGGSGTKKETK